MTNDDQDIVEDLLTEAFGQPSEPRPLDGGAGRTRWVAWVDGEPAATILHAAYHSYYRGVEVQTAGVTGVAVAAEHRGDGLLRPMMDELLAHSRSRGDKIASLFPTAGGIYRGLGFARILQIGSVDVPTMSLGRLKSTVSSRRATKEDDHIIDSLYRQWARRHDGPLTRDGLAWNGDTLWVKDPTLTTIFENEDGPTGYMRVKRGKPGKWEDVVIEVPELIALDAPTARSALASLASYETVAASVRLFSPGDVDPLQWLLPSNAWKPLGDREPYMIRLVDPTALGALPAPAGIEADLPFRVGDDGWVAHIHDGRIAVQPDAGAVVSHARRMKQGALAVTFAGALPSSAQRAIGLLTGPDVDDAVWDAVFTGGRMLAIRDAF